MTSSDLGREMELDRVRDALRMIDAPTPGIISAIARMPLIRVFACLAELERRQLAFRLLGDQWCNT
jgi:hypothetical protein